VRWVRRGGAVLGTVGLCRCGEVGGCLGGSRGDAFGKGEVGGFFWRGEAALTELFLKKLGTVSCIERVRLAFEGKKSENFERI
jgi:hypothetical protein